MGNIHHKKIPDSSPLGLVLKNWDKWPNPKCLSAEELAKLCYTRWPTYKLGRDIKWPKYGTFETLVITALELYLSNECSPSPLNEEAYLELWKNAVGSGLLIGCNQKQERQLQAFRIMMQKVERSSVVACGVKGEDWDPLKNLPPPCMPPRFNPDAEKRQHGTRQRVEQGCLCSQCEGFRQKMSEVSPSAPSVGTRIQVERDCEAEGHGVSENVSDLSVYNVNSNVHTNRCESEKRSLSPAAVTRAARGGVDPPVRDLEAVKKTHQGVFPLREVPVGYEGKHYNFVEAPLSSFEVRGWKDRLPVYSEDPEGFTKELNLLLGSLTYTYEELDNILKLLVTMTELGAIKFAAQKLAINELKKRR